MGYENLIQPLVERARRKPEQLAMAFLHDDGRTAHISSFEFHRRSCAFARALQAIQIGPEDLVVLVLRHSEELVSAFWGALYLGAVPSIFPFLTEKLDPVIYMERVRALVAHSGVRAVITFPEFKDVLGKLLSEVGCRVLSVADVPLAANTDWQPDGLTSADKIAFLQHSSGTTGLQKGVALSHGAVLNQVQAYGQAIQLREEDIIVSWLPLYHDMGLIAGFVMPLVAGIPLIMLSPFKWVKDPAVLFQAIHRYRGTLCWLPNFAFNHSVRSIRSRDLEGIDLSSWRAAINCSEPVREDSHRMFVERFAAYGFSVDALATCYAMAENTFAVTQSEIGQPPRVEWIETAALQAERCCVLLPAGAAGSTPMVSCGFPISGVQLRIMSEDGRILPERRVGEIALKGSSMLSGYYLRPDATAQAIRDGWYYTGDMGYLSDGQLYVSGRKKDLIIVGGKNIYPQDLEAIANVIPGIYPGRSVAFGIADTRMGTEEIVMVCELKQALSPEGRLEIERELRRRVVQQTEVTLADVRLVDKRWLIKTSSGKIARGDNRAKYLAEFVHA